MAQFRTRAGAEHQRQGAEDRRHRRHHDWAKAQQRGLVDRLARRFALVALRLEREVDHHDAVLLDDADQQNDADDRDNAEIAAVDHQRQECADAGRRQRREDRDRVDVALVKYAEHDVDGDDRRNDQQQLVAEGGLKRERRALECREHAGRKPNLALGVADRVDRVAKRGARRQVERYRRRGKLAEMSDRQGRGLLNQLGDRRERHLTVCRGR